MKASLQILALYVLITGSGSNALAQERIADSITLKGTVIDYIYHEPVMAAVILVSNIDKPIAGAVTDFDGNYLVKAPGSISDTFWMSVKYLGFKEHRIIDIVIKEQTIVLDTILLHPSPIIEEKIITTYGPIPMLDRYEGGMSKTISSDEIEHMGH